MTPDEVFRFGDYDLCVQSRELRRSDELVELEPRVFDLLTFLLRNRERVVSKDELLDTLWPGTIVAETSLARCVMKARRAVGDDADGQHTIKTVHGRGYRFIADLADNADPDSAVMGSERKTRRAWPLRLAAGTLVFAGLLGVFLTWQDAPRTDGTVPRVAVLPVANETGDARLDWVSFGLMDILAGELRQQTGLRVAASSDVVAILNRRNAAGDVTESVPAQLLEQLGATHVIRTTLERPGQLYRLEAQIVAEDGIATDIELLGSEPLALVTELRRVIDTRVAGARRSIEVARVISDDVFVNEAYARGQDQLLRGNVDEAHTLLKAAVDQESDNYWARHALATATLNQGDAERAAEMLSDLVEEARSKGLALEEATSLFVLGNTYLRRQVHDRAEELYREALLGFEALELHYEQGKVLNNLAIIVGGRRDLMEERAVLERSAQAFKAAGLESTPGAVLGGLGNNALDRGQLDDAQQYFEAALVSLREQGAKDQQAVALFSLSRVAEYRGDFAAARSLALQSRDLSQEIGQRYGESASLRRVGLAAHAEGDLDGAETAYREAIALGREIGALTSVAATLADLAEVERMRGRYDEALELLDESSAMAHESNDRVGISWTTILRGRVALDQGHTDRALEAVETILTRADAESPIRLAETHFLRGRALAAAGEPDEAAAALETAYEYAVQTGNRVTPAKIATAQGRLSLAEARADLALAYLGIARDAAPELYEVLALAGAIAAEDGNLDLAAELLGQARQRAGGLWTDGDEALRQTLRADAPTNRSPPAPGTE